MFCDELKEYIRGFVRSRNTSTAEMRTTIKTDELDNLFRRNSSYFDSDRIKKNNPLLYNIDSKKKLFNTRITSNRASIYAQKGKTIEKLQRCLQREKCGLLSVCELENNQNTIVVKRVLKC